MIELHQSIRCSKGSIYKRENRWWISVTITHRNHDGSVSKKRKVVSAGRTKDEARAVLNSIHRDIFLIATGARKTGEFTVSVTIINAISEYLESRNKVLTIRGHVRETQLLNAFGSWIVKPYSDRFPVSEIT